MKKYLIVIIVLLLAALVLSSCTSEQNTNDLSEVLFGSSDVENSIDNINIPSEEENPLMQVTDTEDLQVLFINVGKADSILISAGERHYLIDTGEQSSVVKLFSALNLMNVQELDGVFLTHTHADHTGGMESLAKYYPIKMLYTAQITEPSKSGKTAFEKLAEKLNIPHTTLAAGENVQINDAIRLDVLAPLVQNKHDDNDNSLVLQLNANGISYLFTGDMQFAEEETLLETGADLSAKILKVGNHGNPDATSEAFAKAVSPDYAIISTDRNVDKDSANVDVLARLGRAKAYLTEDYDVGILTRLDDTGKISIGAMERPQVNNNVCIEQVDTKTQCVTIRNNGERQNISNYILYSTFGNEIYTFPNDSFIEADQTITICSEDGSGDYVWPEKKIWTKKKKDHCELYDPYGVLLDRFDSKSK